MLQLLDVLEDWSLYVEENKSWDAVYLDLAIVRHEYGLFSMDLEVGYKVFFLMESCR